MARLLATTLDPGEAEAIALALEMSADLILMDERDGRSAAERAGLPVTGVLGVLLRAKNEGQIQLIKPEVDALRTRARFFLSARLQEKAFGDCRGTASKHALPTCGKMKHIALSPFPTALATVST